MINWKVRLKNKTFWITIIPIIILLITQIGDLFGIKIDLSDYQEKILGIVGVVFLLLGMLGISVDPTTEGIGDSLQASMYDRPSKKIKASDPVAMWQALKEKEAEKHDNS